MTAAANAKASPTDAPTTLRRDWPRALAALRRLLRDKDDTRQVFEIMRALNPPSGPRNYLRLVQDPVGARLAFERAELAPRLMDRDWLLGFAPGTVGAAYREFVWSEQLSAAGLAAESERGVDAERVNQPTPLAWYGRRIRDVHDIWHVLTGYGRDGLGEACLVAFSFAQTRALVGALIALGAAARGGGIPGVRAALLEGWRHGRRAAWLPAQDYEVLLAEPIEAARARLGIQPPVRYLAVLSRFAEPGLANPMR